MTRKEFWTNNCICGRLLDILRASKAVERVIGLPVGYQIFFIVFVARTRFGLTRERKSVLTISNYSLISHRVRVACDDISTVEETGFQPRLFTLIVSHVIDKLRSRFAIFSFSKEGTLGICFGHPKVTRASLSN